MRPRPCDNIHEVDPLLSYLRFMQRLIDFDEFTSVTQFLETPRMLVHTLPVSR